MPVAKPLCSDGKRGAEFALVIFVPGTILARDDANRRIALHPHIGRKLFHFHACPLPNSIHHRKPAMAKIATSQTTVTRNVAIALARSSSRIIIFIELISDKA